MVKYCAGYEPEKNVYCNDYHFFFECVVCIKLTPNEYYCAYNLKGK